jgi:hypothetical protein
MLQCLLLRFSSKDTLSYGGSKGETVAMEKVVPYLFYKVILEPSVVMIEGFFIIR